MRTIDAERLSTGSEGKVCKDTLVLLSLAWVEQVLPASSCMAIFLQVESTVSHFITEIL